MTKGERLRKRREQLGLSQTEVANSVNVSKQTLYKYENDIVTNIPSDKIEALARKLETTPEFLMGWEVQKINTVLPVFNEGDDLDRMVELYTAYTKAIPEIQAAVESLLKPQLPDS